MLQALRLEDTRLHVVFEMLVVDRDSDEVEPHVLASLCIAIREKVLEELRVNPMTTASG